MITLDLHGVKHEDAYNKVSRVIEDNLDRNTMITVVTGNSSKMSEIVTEVLEDYKIEVPELQLKDTQIVFYT